jgi:2,4-dienoyl-CoA reductase-like NADH-dependent reductase (Old Yellow Enzyme family)
MTTSLFTPLTLPNGSTLPNRLAKAAMEENLADAGQLPGPALWRLYAAWGAGGAGLLITGNVMIDARALTGPGGVVLERDTPLEPFKQWAAAARQHGGTPGSRSVATPSVGALRGSVGAGPAQQTVRRAAGDDRA